MKESSSGFNDPQNICKKLEKEFKMKNIEITKIQKDDYFRISWVIELLIDDVEYRFTWDNREKWLVFAVLGGDKKYPKNWEDIHVYRYNKTTKTSEEKKSIRKTQYRKNIDLFG